MEIATGSSTAPNAATASSLEANEQAQAERSVAHADAAARHAARDLPEPFAQGKRWRLYCGDALELLPKLSGYDAVMADPPYSSGSRLDAGKPIQAAISKFLRDTQWLDKWFKADQMAPQAFVWFMRTIFTQLAQGSQDVAALWCWIDWRSWPALFQACESTGWIVRSQLVWAKKGPGLGLNQFRAQHELVLYAEKGRPDFKSNKVGTVFVGPRIPQQWHPTQKPVELMRTFLEAVDIEHVLDPFAGSASSGVAAIRAGLEWTGIELDPRFAHVAAERLKNVEADQCETAE
jgi:site-specific DNA-methyltransferase (adenine-specific)